MKEWRSVGLESRADACPASQTAWPASQTACPASLTPLTTAKLLPEIGRNLEDSEEERLVSLSRASCLVMRLCRLNR